MEDRKVIYLIGPNEETDGWREFEKADDLLTSRGYCVLNPATLPLGLTALSRAAVSNSMLTVADAVFILPGVQNDPKASSEYLQAITNSKPRYRDIEKLCEEVPAI